MSLESVIFYVIVNFGIATKKDSSNFFYFLPPPGFALGSVEGRVAIQVSNKL